VPGLMQQVLEGRFPAEWYREAGLPVTA
jgi:hypothetical protein